MASNAKGIYRFTSSKSGEVFEGYADESKAELQDLGVEYE